MTAIRLVRRRGHVRGGMDLEDYEVGQEVDFEHWHGIVRACKKCGGKYLQWQVGTEARIGDDVYCLDCYVEIREAQAGNGRELVQIRRDLARKKGR